MLDGTHKILVDVNDSLKDATGQIYSFDTEKGVAD
jgi:hypothetical protein